MAGTGSGEPLMVNSTVFICDCTGRVPMEKTQIKAVSKAEGIGLNRMKMHLFKWDIWANGSESMNDSVFFLKEFRF